MSTPTLINFVLDKSGSMAPLRQSSLDGYNEFLQEQKTQSGECRLSLTTFDTSLDVRYVAKDIRLVPGLMSHDYVPGGGTALLDAVGVSIKGTEQWIANNNAVMPYYPPGQNPRNRGWKVIVAVLTDGEENSSREWHINQPPLAGDDRDLLNLISWKQNMDAWEFVFLGAGGSQWLERTFGSVVAKDHFVGYDHSPLAHAGTYAGLSSTVSSTLSTGNFDTSQFQR